MTPRTLIRWKVLHLKRGQAPYHPTFDAAGKKTGMATNAQPVYAKRIPGKPSAIVLTPGPHTTTALTSAELAKARKVASRYGWKLIERDASFTYNAVRWFHLGGDLDCNPALLDALEQVAIELSRREGREVRILIRSGKRTIDEQWALFNRNMRWNGSKWVPKAGRPLTAYPNPNAPHVVGRAADCGIDGLDLGDYPGAIAACARHGVGYPVASEDWHAELTSSMAGAHS